MTQLNQSGIHPGADSLSAFAEHALSASERTTVVSHLADCSRCREIVFLAQAAAEAGAPAALPLPALQPRRSLSARLAALLNPWRHVWVPAAALASIGIVTLFVMRPHQPATSIAQNSPQEHALAPPPPLASSFGQTTSPQPAAKSVAAPTHTETPTDALRKPLVRTAPPVPLRVPQAIADSTNTPASTSLSSEDLPTPATAPASLSVVTPGNAPEAEARLSGGLSRAHSSAPAPPPQPAKSVQLHGSAFGLSAAGQIQPPQPVFDQQPTYTGIQPGTPLALLRLPRQVKLPNGLVSVSAVVAPDRMLALDPNGSLFLSRDAGKEWETIPSQWGGKAVSILPAERAFRLRQETGAAPQAGGTHTTTAATAPNPGGAAALQPLQPELFRLINDSHQSWLSIDGKVWRPE